MLHRDQGYGYPDRQERAEAWHPCLVDMHTQFRRREDTCGERPRRSRQGLQSEHVPTVCLDFVLMHVTQIAIEILNEGKRFIRAIANILLIVV